MGGCFSLGALASPSDGGEQATATAGPSTPPLAKCARGFAQDDKFLEWVEKDDWIKCNPGCLLASEGFHWVDGGGSAGWEVAGQERCGEEDQAYDGEGGEVHRLDAV